MNCAIRAIIYSTIEIIFFDESFYRIGIKKIILWYLHSNNSQENNYFSH